MQKQKCLFSLIRGTRLDEILNTKMNTRKQIGQILEQFEKN